MRDLTSLLPLIAVGAGILFLFIVAPFWTAIIFMVLVLLLVTYIILAMAWAAIKQMAKLLVASVSIVYDAYGGTRNGDYDD